MEVVEAKRIFITGGPGTGKTTLAKRISSSLSLPIIHLDYEVLDREDRFGMPFAEPPEWLHVLAEQDSWVAEGSFLRWTEPILTRANLVIALEVPWAVASYRILSRHIKAELLRNNRFPGWKKLGTFWSWSRRYYQNTNSPGLNPWGVPNTQQEFEVQMKRLTQQVLFCRTRAESNKLIRLLLQQKA